MAGWREVSERVRVERGERLREQRLALKGARGRPMTQKELGAPVGLSIQQVSKYERGQDLMSAGWAYRFALAMGCPFKALFVGGRFELAEPRAAFLRDDDAFELPALLSLANERLTDGRRAILRDVLLELLDEEEAGVPGAPSPSVAGGSGIL